MSVLIKGLNIKPCKDGFDGKGLVIIGYDDKLYCVAHEQIIPLPDHGDLEAALPIDAVPVVRCKDCKHNYSKEHNKRYNLEDIVCDYWGTDGLNDDDFCSYGERSEE